MTRPIDSPPVIALVDDPDTALSWWRITAPFARLRQHHVHARTTRLADTQTTMLPGQDVAIFPRLFPSGPDGREKMTFTYDAFREHAAALVYDTDDDLYSEAYVEHHLRSDWGDGKDSDDMRRQCEDSIWAMEQCDGVTVASEALGELVRTLTSRPVHVVPNAIDVRWFRSRLAARSLWADRLTVGWAGGRRPPEDFTAVAEAWGRVARRRPDVVFVAAGDASARRFVSRHVPSDQLRLIDWAHVQDQPMAMQVDVGCCAVEGTPFDLRKTTIKCWEYALAGAAVVATPALYSQDVAHGINGLLATTADEWEAAILALLDDVELRRHLASALALRVEQRHSLDVELHNWPDAWRSIIESKTRSEVAA